MVQPSKVNGTELGVQEWQDALFLKYGLDPPDLTIFCEGCNGTFSICHSLDCKKGSLVTAWNNDISDEVADLTGKAFTSMHVHNDPLIFTSCAAQRLKAHPDGTTT